MDISKWRAPSWFPRFLRARFPGVWTQEEVDEIHRRAHRRYEDTKWMFD